MAGTLKPDEYRWWISNSRPVPVLIDGSAAFTSTGGYLDHPVVKMLGEPKKLETRAETRFKLNRDSRLCASSFNPLCTIIDILAICTTGARSIWPVLWIIYRDSSELFRSRPGSGY